MPGESSSGCPFVAIRSPLVVSCKLVTARLRCESVASETHSIAKIASCGLQRTSTEIGLDRRNVEGHCDRRLEKIRRTLPTGICPKIASANSSLDDAWQRKDTGGKSRGN